MPSTKGTEHSTKFKLSIWRLLIVLRVQCIVFKHKISIGPVIDFLLNTLQLNISKLRLIKNGVDGVLAADCIVFAVDQLQPVMFLN